MKTKIRLKQPISVLIIAAFLNLCWVSSQGWAHMITTETAVERGIENLSQREKLHALINRKDLQPQLEQYGVSREEALARLNSLTDAEVSQLAAEIDQLPEGQGDVAVAILLILVIAVIVAWLTGVIKIAKAAFGAPPGNSTYNPGPYVESLEDTSSPEAEY